MAEIVLSKVSKRFPDGTLAVDDVDLAISDGEFVILVGPSGCGKSTTLNMIAGLESVSSGEVVIDGRRMNEIAPRERDIAMVFQSYALYPHMTVRENIDFPLRLAKVDKRTADAKVEDTARMLDLLPYLDRKPAGLSGGQRQRVAMGRAIVRDPKAFLMDEPLSNLDAKLRVQTRAQIARLQRRLGTTTVYVTHDQSEAMTLGDRIVIMRAGVVQQVGAPEELYEHPHNLFVAGFIGSPTMNFLSAEMGAEGMRTAIGLIPYGERVRRAMGEREVPGDVIVGIRPEAFEDVALAPAAAPAAPSTPASGFRRLRGRSERAERQEQRPRPAPASTFTGTVDVLEAMGAEKIVYFALDAETLRSEHRTDEFRDIAADDVTGDGQLIVRLDPRTRARRGERLEVAYDPEAVHVFDPATGLNLTEPATADRSVPA